MWKRLRLTGGTRQPLSRRCVV